MNGDQSCQKRSLARCWLLSTVSLYLITVPLMLLSCTVNSASLSSETAPPETSAMVVIRQTEAGQTIEVRVGDRVEILLDENPSTGYRWEIVASDRELLTEIASSFLQSDAGRPGGGGVRRFELAVNAPGETTLVLELRRPWETEQAPAETFSVTIQASAEE